MPIINDLPRGDREEMIFEPKTREQIKDEKLLPAGEYTFQVTAAKDDVSQAGNSMLTLTLSVNGPNGKRLVTDWIRSNDEEKILGFCEATGTVDLYASGKLGAADCLGLAGHVKLKVAPAKGSFDAKNMVQLYIPNVKPSGLGIRHPAQTDELVPF
jgi:hypothetical protein